MATSKLACEVKARYLQLGSILDVVPPDDGRGLPTVFSAAPYAQPDRQGIV